jgi:hypothetical protein
VPQVEQMNAGIVSSSSDPTDNPERHDTVRGLKKEIHNRRFHIICGYEA